MNQHSKPPDSPPPNPYDWYKTTIELGNYEAEFGAKRFHDGVTHHLAIAGGILALAAFALSNGVYWALLFCVVLSLLGAFNASLWMNELRASRQWTMRWRRSAAYIEQSSEFKKGEGMPAVNVFSISKTEETKAIERQRQKAADAKELEAHPLRTYLRWVWECLFEAEPQQEPAQPSPATGPPTATDKKMPKTFWDEDSGLGAYATRWRFTAKSFAWFYVGTCVISILALSFSFIPACKFLVSKPDSQPSTNYVVVLGPLNVSSVAASQPSTNSVILLTPLTVSNVLVSGSTTNFVVLPLPLGATNWAAPSPGANPTP